MQVHLVISFFLIFFFAAVVDAQNNAMTGKEEPFLEANEPLVYDGFNKTVTAKGSAVLQTQNFLIAAEKIIFDRNKWIISASDKVVLSAEGYRILCDNLTLDLKTGDFNAHEVKTGLYPWVLETKQLLRKKGSFSSIDSFLSKRNGPNLGPNINFPRMYFDENKSRLVADWSWLRQGNVNLIPIPPLQLNSDLKRSLKGNLILGRKNNLGWYFGTRTEIISSHTESNFEIIGYSNRGILLSPKFIYSSEANSTHSTNAKLEIGWIQDQENYLGLDRRGEPFSRDRSFLEAYFLSLPDDYWRLAGQVEWESDSEIIREFKSDRFENRQWLDHFAEISWEHSIGGVSGLSRWQVNEHDAQVEQIPTFRLDFGPINRPLQSTYHSTSIEYSNLNEKDAYGTSLNKSKKLDFSFQTYHPIELTSGISYIPSYTIRKQSYGLGPIDARQIWTEWGNELSFHLHGDYDLKNEIWEINGFRHSMNFVLRHHKIRSIDQKNASFIPKIDASAYSLNLEPMNLMDFIEADNLVPQELWRLQWTNTILASYKKETKELARVMLANDFWIKNRVHGVFSPNYYFNFEVNPADWIQFKAKSKFNDSDSTSRINAFSIYLFDGIDREYGISYLKYLNFGGQWVVESTHLLDPRKTLFFSARFDSRSKSIPYWRGILEYNPNNQWVYILSMSKRNGTLREDELDFNLGIRLHSF